MFTVHEAAGWCRGTVIAGSGDRVIADHAEVSIDSRKAGNGDLFVALIGPNHDAHHYLDQVASAGVSAILVSDRDATHGLPEELTVILVGDTEQALGMLARGYRDQYPIPVAAITGSCGKTTTKEMTRQALISADMPEGSSHFTAGNFNNQIGLPLTLLGLRQPHQRCVVEMGINHAGEMDLLCDIAAPNIGLITCIGAAHLQGLGNEAGVAAAKGRLFARLIDQGSSPATAVINLDDPRIVALVEDYQPPRAITYSTRRAARADVTVTVQTDHTVELGITGQVRRLTLADHAPYQLHNAAAAAALAYGLGASIDAIADGLSRYTPAATRGQRVQLASGAVLIDDTYNANPDAMVAAVTALSKLPVSGRRMAVLGDMLELGDDAGRWHHRLGVQLADAGLDRLICVGEFAAELADGARMGSAEIYQVADALDATAMLTDLNEGDTVLIKGSRGLTMERLVAQMQSPDSGPEATA